MSHLNPGLISAYNSLTDKHLAGYFSSIRIRRHLQRAGLITRSGRIVPDREYRHKQIQRSHQRHVRECLAQAIFHQVLEMERVHQIEIKRRLEEFARRERVNKIKVECSKRYEEDFARILSPHPPSGHRGFRKQKSGPEGENSESSESPGWSRPNTAPEKMQRPMRLKPIHSSSTAATLRRGSPHRLPEASDENLQPFASTMETRRRLTRLEASHGISPYCLPVINNFVTPVPPATKRKESGTRVIPSSGLRSRRFRPATSFSGAEFHEDPPTMRSSVHQSKVPVNMMYLGKTVHLSRDLTDSRDEVKVFQQHCGGENLCVYKGLLHEGETFRFISRRHRGFPFSLTFFLNGLQVERVSSCCEFKHRKGSRLCGRHRHFGFYGVEGASPCYKCIIAMGLDRNSSLPPKWAKEDGRRDKSVFSPSDAPQMKTEKTGEEPASRSKCESSQSQEEDKVRDDYEEDFEADNEDSAGEAHVKENESPSPTCDSRRQVKEKDEKDEDIKSSSASSFSGSDQEDSDEADQDSGEDEMPKNVFKPDPTDERNPEAASATGDGSAGAKGADTRNSAGDNTEVDISATSVPSENKNAENDDTSEDTQAEDMVAKNNQKRAKSVQEKLKKSRRSSEPELSDISTEEQEEEEEEMSHTGPPKDSKDVLLEKAVIGTEQQENLLEETKQALHQNSDGAEDDRVKGDKEDEEAGSMENTALTNEAEETENRSLLPVHKEETHDQTSGPQEDAADKSTDVAEKAEKNKEKTAADADKHLNEPGEEAAGCVSEPDEETDERAVSNNAAVEAMTASQTAEMKGEASEERGAHVCEEAPITDTGKRQQGGSEDQGAVEDREFTADNSSGSLEGSGATIVEKSVETNEDKAQLESNKADIKQEELSEGGTGKEQEVRDPDEEPAEKSVKIDDKGENKSEDECKEEGDPTNAEELAEADKGEENEVDDKDNESKRDSNGEGKTHEQAEKTSSEEDKAAAEERADESRKTEKDKDNDSAKRGNHMKENEANKTTEVESLTDAHTAANPKDDAVVEYQNATDAEPGDAAKNKFNGGTEETAVAPADTVPGEERFEMAGEAEGKTDAVVTEDKLKISGENSTLDVEAANVATKTVETVKTKEAEDVKRERESEESPNVEIDAENGEISSGTDDKSQDEGEAQTAEHTANENESKEVKEVAMDPGDDNVDQACDTDVAQGEAKEGDNKKDGSCKYQNGNLSDHDHESRASAVIKNSTDIQSEITHMKVPSLGDQEQLIPIAVDLDGATPKLEESTKPTRADGYPLTDGNTAAAAELSGADRENESKASEEGASVLLKPQMQPPPIAKSKAKNADVMVAGSNKNPDGLAGEDNIDLVKNWVTMHQASRYFETFVEPLEDLKEPDSQESNSTKMDDGEQKHMAVDINESKDKTKLEGSEFKRSTFEDGQLRVPIKDAVQVEEEKDGRDLIPEAESEQNDSDFLKGEEVRLEENKESSRGSLKEGTTREMSVPDNPEQSDVSRAEVESIADAGHSASSGRPQAASEVQAEEAATENDPGLNEKQTEETERDRNKQTHTQEIEITSFT
ncbi:glutamate-rich protein 3 [Brachionichthys hirsutus]|uniref:glutamate-rich protein 3 n=1 Tax=Brachionichthys hirsutus TaxID=412623 RepID=UPI0036047046